MDLVLSPHNVLTARPSSVLSRNPFSQNEKEGGNVAFKAGRITPGLPNTDGSGAGQEYPLEKFIYGYNLLLLQCLWPAYLTHDMVRISQTNRHRNILRSQNCFTKPN